MADKGKEKAFKGKMLNFRVDEELHKKLKSTSIASGKTISDLITNILMEHIDDYTTIALLEQLRKIDPEKRTALMTKIEAEEAKKAKKGA